MINSKSGKLAVIFLTLAILGEVFWLGVGVGQNIPKVVTVRGVSNIEAPDEVKVDFSPFWEVWTLINSQYLRASEIKDQAKVYGAMRGLVQSLGDPNSEFFNPDDGKKFEEDIQGNFGGIGAEIGTKDERLIIVAPLKNTPAEKSGLKPKDIILKINATSTEGLDVQSAVKIIRGPVGTQVTLTVFREGWEKPRDFIIAREIIAIPTLDFEMKAGPIAYVSLHSFNANANVLFYQAILKALTNGSRGLVLDLRNNPGGFLQVSIDLAGWFLPRGSLVVKEVSRNNEEKPFFANGTGALKDLPVVILVNGGSASASEILAGAIRDYRPVKLVGEKTFGKGTVQQIESLRDGSSVKITTAHWVLPKGQTIDQKGLDPDFEVKMTDEDTENKKDPQLDKAIEVLNEEIAKNKNTLFRLSAE